MINDFNDAHKASEEIFDSEQTPEEQLGTTPEATTSEQTQQEETTLENAAQTAEIAANTAVLKDKQLSQALSEVEALREQNNQLQGTIDELSKINENNLTEEALTPPSLDFNSLAFADEETQKAAMEKYAQDMAEYNRKQIMNEMTPAIEYAKKGMYEAEKAEAIDLLSQMPQLSGIEKMLPQLDSIISGNKWLSSEDMPIEEKYINAYAIAQGVNAINNPPKQSNAPSVEELMEFYNNNSDFREKVEQQRLDQIKKSQQVPIFSTGNGAAGAALDIKERPKSFKEALERSKQQIL